MFQVQAASVLAQPIAKKSDTGIYAIPFASEGNRIELQIVNSTDAALEQVSVDAGLVPTWVKLESASQPIGDLKPGASRVAVFTFDQDERAPVGEVTELRFEVAASVGRLETRTIGIQPEAPTELMLRGNYPNPFNPTTKIAYALPKDGRVEIEVFNAIGHRVDRLVDEVQQAGYRETTWNAAGHPSGVYFYTVRLDVERAGQVKVGRMVVVK